MGKRDLSAEGPLCLGKTSSWRRGRRFGMEEAVMGTGERGVPEEETVRGKKKEG